MTDDLYRLVIKALEEGAATPEDLAPRVDATDADVESELTKLVAQGVVTRQGACYALADGFDEAGDPSLAEQEERRH